VSECNWDCRIIGWQYFLKIQSRREEEVLDLLNEINKITQFLKLGLTRNILIYSGQATPSCPVTPKHTICYDISNNVWWCVLAKAEVYSGFHDLSVIRRVSQSRN
jgi:hypothetical protein